MSANIGRPPRWTEREYFRLWMFVDFLHRRIENPVSVRRACEILLMRKPWSQAGLSAATLRRRHAIAQRLHAAKVIGVHLPPNWTAEDLGKINMDFVLDRRDEELMMTTPRFLRAEAEYERWAQDMQAKYGDQL